MMTLLAPTATVTLGTGTLPDTWTDIWDDVWGGSSPTIDADDGNVLLDITAVPYASAVIEVPLDDPSVIELIDPTAGQRVTVTAGDSIAGTSRTFDLALRSRDVDHKSKKLTLHAACDEALLMDYSLLTDDTGAFAHMSSLRGVINYVLGKVISGAALEASPSNDSDVTVYTDATNMLLDPGTANTPGGGYSASGCSLDTNDTTWSISGDGDSFNLYSPTGSDSYLAIGAQVSTAWGLIPGKTYVLSATGNVKTAFTGTDLAADAADAGGGANLNRVRSLTAYCLRADGVTDVWHSVQVPNTINTPTRVSVEFTVPSNATAWGLRAYLGNTAGQIRWDGLRLSEKNPLPTAENTAYFDGDTADTSVYQYDWTSTPDCSPSTRKNLTGRYPDSLIWRAGQTAWDFLNPLVITAGLMLFCDEQRKWRLVDPGTYALPARIVVTPDSAAQGVDTIDAGDANVYCSGVVVIYQWTDSYGVAQRAVDSAGTAGKVYVVNLPSAYPGPGAAAAILARRAGTGRSQSITALADWTATPAMEISVSLPSTDTQIGRVKSVQWYLGGTQAGQMAVETRGLVDTPDGAIDLLTGTIDALTGTIDALT